MLPHIEEVCVIPSHNQLFFGPAVKFNTLLPLFPCCETPFYAIMWTKTLLLF